MGNNKSQMQMRVGRDIILPSVKPYIPGQMGDDLDGMLGGQGGAGKDKDKSGMGGIDLDDDGDDKNFFASLMN